MKITQKMKSSAPFQYAQMIKSGDITAGKNIKQAVQRFYQWIDEADANGFYLDHKAGMHVILFFEKFIKHTKGELAGQAFELSLYQKFTFYNIFAWKYTATGNRRIRTVYEKVARKNGKTAALAGLGLYCETFDDEDSPEIYVGATKEAQAKILWEQAYDFVYKSQPLRILGLKNTQREIRFLKRMGKFRFLGGDSKTQDGLNPSLAIIDEYHAHKDDSVREVLESAMGSRENPLIYIITTAGFNPSGVCKQAEDVYKEILNGDKVDENILIMIHDLDDDDDWKDQKNWVKSNPNLGVSVRLTFLKSEFQKAINQPSKIPNFKTKHLNMWVDAEEVRISSEIWESNGQKARLKNFVKYGCAGAIDLSSTTDLSALVFITNEDDKGFRDILPLFFCPKDTIKKRSKEDGVSYNQWAKELIKNYVDLKGFKDVNNFFKKQTILHPTHGNQIDYNEIQNFVAFMWQLLKPKWIEYDSWQAVHLVQNLDERDVEMNPFPQTITHFSFPTKEFEKLAYSKKLRHGNNPILKWMMSGCVAITDPNENLRYSKKHSTKRIDGIIATVMALAGTMTNNDNNSHYNKISKNEITFG